MTECWISTLILPGVVIAVLALWYASYRIVRWDLHRRKIRSLECKVWSATVIALPIFGGALYLAVQVLRRDFAPPATENNSTGGNTDVYVPSASLKREMEYLTSKQGYQQPDSVLQQVQAPEPAWGSTHPARSNGKAHNYTTPKTVMVQHQTLRTQYTLEAVEGPLQGQQFPVLSLPIRVGRGEEAGIALDADLNVSRKHAEIYEWNGMLWIRDLGSMHGIQVNGAKINDQALNPGDRITIGGTVLILRELS